MLSHRKRVRDAAEKPAPASRWVVIVSLLAVVGAVLAIGVLARQRMERRLEAEAARGLETLQPVSPRADATREERDLGLDKALSAAESPEAPLSALDAAAHALLVRERFDEAEPFVSRALALAPRDAEAAIHRAVLRGVAGDTAGARVELERRARGEAGWEASLFSAGFALRDGDDAAALRALRRFCAEAPPAEVSPELTAKRTELEARVRAGSGKSRR